MELRNFLSSTTELSNCEGPQDHVVLSSRVRLARNVKGRPFPGRAKKASRIETCEFIQPAIAAASAMRGSFSESMQMYQRAKLAGSAYLVAGCLRSLSSIHKNYQ